MKTIPGNQLEIDGRRGSFSGLRSVGRYIMHFIEYTNTISIYSTNPINTRPATIRRAGTPTQEALCV